MAASPDSYLNDDFNEFRIKERIFELVLNSEGQGDGLVDIGTNVHTQDSRSLTFQLLPFSLDIKSSSYVVRTDFTVNLERETLVGAKSIGSTIRDQSYYCESAKSFPHDFTFEPISNNTDVRIDSILKGITNPFKHYTPDYLSIHEGKLLAIEFTTSQIEQGLLSALRRKIDKYYMLLQQCLQEFNEMNKSDMRCHFCVIAVSPSVLMSTHYMDQEIVDELTYRYRLGLNVQNSAMRVLNICDKDFDSTSNAFAAKSFFKNVKMKDMEGEYSIKNYEMMMKPAPPESIEEIEKNIRIDMKKDIKDRILDYSKTFKYSNPDGRNKNVKICEERYHNYIKDTENKIKESHRRTDMKSVVQFPLLFAQKSSNSSFTKLIKEKGIPSYEEGNVMGNFIREIICKIDSGDIFIPEEDESQERPNLKEFLETNASEVDLMDKALDYIEGHDYYYSRESKKSPGERSQYHRIKVETSKATKIELAKLGISGKKYKEDLDVKQYREEHSGWFSPLETPVNDINDFFDSDQTVEILFSKCQDSTNVQQVVNQLIYSSIGHHDTSFDLNLASSRFLDHIMDSHIGNLATLISDIAVELCISLRQNCLEQEFIVKKLRNFNVWIIIKPTNSSSHIFYSIFTYKDCIHEQAFIKEFLNHSKVFKPLMISDNIFFTQFTSMNMSKLVNWILCESRLISLYSFWLNAYGISAEKNLDNYDSSPYGIKEPAENKLLYARKMTIMGMIINLIDKAEVEEHMSLLRYITLEGLSTMPYYPQPYKMFSKFSPYIRNRFTLWVIQKLYDYSRDISNGIVTIEVSSITDEATNTPNRKTWLGFRNPYLSHPIDSPQMMINLFYIGYLKNKDEYPENNTISKLYEKILVIEDELSSQNSLLIGQENKPWGSDEKHVYNIDLIKMATDSVIMKLKKDNPNILEDIEAIICDKIGSYTLDPQFTTLKASSCFNETMFDLKELPKKYKRVKVIEATKTQTLKEEYKLLDVLPRVCDEVFTRQYMLIDIFQKNQHGGLREIYVLSLMDRIIQYVIELMARSICSAFPGETMTHPRNKKIIPESHHLKTQSRFGNGYITMGLSADATKWSQNHYAHKFAIILMRFLPSYMHGFIWNTLHLWKDKRILLNPTLLMLLDKSNIQGFYSEPIQNLYDAYHGKKQLPWYEKGKSYLKVKTGMMQGILHYTSSLFHSVLNEYSKTVTLDILSSKTKVRDLPEIDMLQSSDDSCMIISIKLTPDRLSLQKAYMQSAIAISIKEIIGRECSIINSIKTTNNTIFFHEFNSEFKFGSNHYRPDIKFMISLPLISEQEALISRQEEWSTLLTQYIENGGSTWPVHLGQISQALLHYKLLGSSVSPSFIDYSSIIQILCDPSLGYFVMDAPLAAGLLGFKYNLWNLSRKTALGKLHKKYIFQISEANPEKIEVTSAGSLSRTVKMIYGDRKKWLAMVSRMDLIENWREEINENAKVLYNGIASRTDLEQIISYKMHTSGVSESVSKGNVISRTIASSVYILNFECLSKMKDWQSAGDDLYKKKSIFGLMLEAMKSINHEEPLSEEELQILYPFHKDYRSIEYTLKNLTKLHMRPTFKDYRRRVTDIHIAESVKMTNMPMKEIVRQIWFPETKNNLLTHKTASLIFRELQKIVPWLNEDHGKTIDKSPFEDAISLYNWVNSVSSKERVVRLLGTPITSSHGKSSLLSAILLNFQADYKLENELEIQYRLTTPETKHLLCAASRSPFSKERALNLMSRILSLEQYQIRFDPNCVRSRENNLAIIQYAMENKPLVEIVEMIKINRIGVVGGFTKTGKASKTFKSTNQYSIHYKGESEWEGVIHGVNIRLLSAGIKLTDTIKSDRSYTGKLTKIETNNLYESINIMGDIIQLCNELGLYIGTHDNVRLSSYSRYGLTKMGLSTTYGIPITHTSRRFQFNIDDMYSIGVLFQRDIIRLRAKLLSGVEITLLNYKILDSDWHGMALNKDLELINSLPHQVRMQSAAWIYNESLSVKDATSLLDKIATAYTIGFTTIEPEKQVMYNILREVLIATLIRKGICRTSKDWRFSNAAKKLQPEVDLDLSALMADQDADEDMMAEFNLSDVEEEKDSEFCETISTSFDIDQMIGEEELSAEYLLGLLESEQIIQYEKSGIYRQHNLLTRYVDDILKLYALPNISTCFELMRVTNITEPLRNLIAIYAGVPPEVITIVEEESDNEPRNVDFD